MAAPKFTEYSQMLEEQGITDLEQQIQIYEAEWGQALETDRAEKARLKAEQDAEYVTGLTASERAGADLEGLREYQQMSAAARKKEAAGSDIGKQIAENEKRYEALTQERSKYLIQGVNETGPRFQDRMIRNPGKQVMDRTRAKALDDEREFLVSENHRLREMTRFAGTDTANIDKGVASLDDEKYELMAQLKDFESKNLDHPRVQRQYNAVVERLNEVTESIETLKAEQVRRADDEVIQGLLADPEKRDAYKTHVAGQQQINREKFAVEYVWEGDELKARRV